MTGVGSCLPLNDIPASQALDFYTDVQKFGYLYNSSSINTNKPDHNLVLSPFFNTWLEAFSLKEGIPFKQYQPCFTFAFDTPFEFIVGNITNIKNSSTPNQTMIYYLGEVGQVKYINNSLYEVLKSQKNLVTTMANGDPVPNYITLASGTVSVFTDLKSSIGLHVLKYQGCSQSVQANFYQAIEIRDNTALILNFTYSLNFTFQTGGTYKI